MTLSDAPAAPPAEHAPDAANDTAALLKARVDLHGQETVLLDAAQTLISLTTAVLAYNHRRIDIETLRKRIAEAMVVVEQLNNFAGRDPVERLAEHHLDRLARETFDALAARTDAS